MRAFNYLEHYKAAKAILETDPSNLTAQHAFVLALARMGSLTLAEQSYHKFGLHQVRQNEDIMALGGRLAKDRHLLATGETALIYARQAADRYAAAFQDTGGWYSGINAATMSLLADSSIEDVKKRAQAVLDSLPNALTDVPETRYYSEATRAEGFLLQGQIAAARHSLHDAVAHDPLNYTAHATTLKQFQLILEKCGETTTWLSEFAPPRPAHFAGPIRGLDLSGTHRDLPDKVTDIIQTKDIGAGFGALAAGSDILIAECLLGQGAELHVQLPEPREQFIEHSVRPFGQGWVARFDACFKAATTHTVLPPENSKVDIQNARWLSGCMTMGQTCLAARDMGVTPAQILILDRNRPVSLTARHGQLWSEVGHTSYVLDVEIEPTSEGKDTLATLPHVLLSTSEDVDTASFQTLSDALKAVEPDLSQLMQFDIGQPKTDKETMLARPNDGSCLLSEPVAFCLALLESDQASVQYAGFTTSELGRDLHSYTLHSKTQIPS